MMTGMWAHLGQDYRCSVPSCEERLGVGSRVFVLGDGTTFCEEHGKPKEAEVLAARKGEAAPSERDCVVCGEPIDNKPAGQQTCSRKCGATLKKRNKRPARDAMAPQPEGF